MLKDNIALTNNQYQTIPMKERPQHYLSSSVEVRSHYLLFCTTCSNPTGV